MTARSPDQFSSFCSLRASYSFALKGPVEHKKKPFQRGDRKCVGNCEHQQAQQHLKRFENQTSTSDIIIMIHLTIIIMITYSRFSAKVDTGTVSTGIRRK